MRIFRSFPLAGLLGVASVLCGCAGYHIGPVKPQIMSSIRTVAVPSFKNETLEPRVEVQLANAVIKQIQQDGTYAVTDDKHADAIIECTLEHILRRPARSVRGNVLQTREYTLTLDVHYRVVNRQTGAVISNQSVNGSTNFFESGSTNGAGDVNQDERQAIPLAAEELAVRLVSQISEGW